jgi:hypothetical protein
MLRSVADPAGKASAFIRTDKGQTFYLCLNDQQSVEWIVVMLGQICNRKCVVVLDRQF